MVTAFFLFLGALLAQSPPTRIAFAARLDGNWDILVTDLSGRPPIRLTRHAGGERFPVWSPDGSRIAYGAEREGKWELYVMSADGGQPRLLTRDFVAKGPRSWSPDGTRILFESLREGNAEIYVIDVASGRVPRLTGTPPRNAHPSGLRTGRASLSPPPATAIARSTS